MNERGYIGLVMLVLGAALSVWLLLYASPLRNNEAGENTGQNIIDQANAVKGMADHRDGEIEAAMEE